MSALAVDLFAHAALAVAGEVTAALGAPPKGVAGRGRCYSAKSEALYVAIVLLGAQKTAAARACGVSINHIPRILGRVEDARDRGEIEARHAAIEARIYGGAR